MVFFIGLGESKTKYACYSLTLSLVIASSINRFQGGYCPTPPSSTDTLISMGVLGGLSPSGSEHHEEDVQVVHRGKLGHLG
jgi:hypothetical protein